EEAGGGSNRTRLLPPLFHAPGAPCHSVGATVLRSDGPRVLDSSLLVAQLACGRSPHVRRGRQSAAKALRVAQGTQTASRIRRSRSGLPLRISIRCRPHCPILA